jgi:hypothetical protein
MAGEVRAHAEVHDVRALCHGALQQLGPVGGDQRHAVGAHEPDDCELRPRRDAPVLASGRRPRAGHDPGHVRAVADRVLLRGALHAVEGRDLAVEVLVAVVDAAVEDRNDLAGPGPLQALHAHERARVAAQQAGRLVQVEPPHTGEPGHGGHELALERGLEADEQVRGIQHLDPVDLTELRAE